MKRVLLLALSLALGACQMREQIHVHKDPGPNPWTHLVLNNDPDDFQFAIVSDRTGRMRAGVFESALPKINLLQPEFVMSVGDFIKGYTEDEAQLNKQWDEFQTAIKTLEMPFFYIPGNHDYANGVQALHWHRRFGRSYFHFVYRNVLFLCLNSEDPPLQNMSEQQVAYFEKALNDNKNVRWTLVFMHEPLWTTDKKTGWPKFEKLLMDRKHTVFAGHVHTYTKYVRHNSKYIVLATTGGGQNPDLLDPHLGCFDHISWITMKKDGPRIAHLQLEGIFDENVRTEYTASLINNVIRGDVLGIDPVFTTEKEFKGDTTRIRLANPSTAPLHIKGKFRDHPGIKVEPATIDATLAPNASQEIELKLTTEKPQSAASLTSLILDWEAIYDVPDAKPLRIPRSTTILPTPRLACTQRNSPALIDGKLDDWTELPFTADPPEEIAPTVVWDGPADLSLRFATQYDKDFVYVAVRSKDDISVVDLKASATQQDTIEIRLDARPEPQRSLGIGLDDSKNFITFSISPGTTPTEPTIHSAKNLPPGTKAAMTRTDDGYIAEFAIPVAYLNEKQTEPWKAFRLNVSAIDLDKPKGQSKSVNWHPAWRSKSNITGSGTFDKR